MPTLEACAIGTLFGQGRGVAASVLQQDQLDVLLTLLPEAMAALEGRGPGDTFASLRQSFAAELFGYLNTASPAALERLDQLLNWPYWEVRMKVCEALGKLHRSIPNTAIQRLLELRHDPQSRSVREVADDALAEILTLEAGVENDEI